MYCGSGAAYGNQGVTTLPQPVPATGGATTLPMPLPEEDCEDCVRTVTTYKTVQVPCTRNVNKTFVVKVPKTINYTAYRPVTKYKNVVRQVPKTIYVSATVQEPYTIQEAYQATKTEMIDESRTSCRPVTTMITRKIPVVQVIPVNPPPCPPGPGPMPGPTPIGIPVAPGGAFAQRGTLVGKDANYDGVISSNEMGFIPNRHGHGGGYPDVQPMPVPGPNVDPQPMPVPQPKK